MPTLADMVTETGAHVGREAYVQVFSRHGMVGSGHLGARKGLFFDLMSWHTSPVLQQHMLKRRSWTCIRRKMEELECPLQLCG